MRVHVEKSMLRGEISIPSSKSQSIRAVIFASLAKGTSTIDDLLASADADSCLQACRTLGARIQHSPLRIEGPLSPHKELTLDLGNSGTSLFFLTALAALYDIPITLTGDDSLCQRSAEPLLAALQKMGACIAGGPTPPYTIQGPVSGSALRISCPTSQYLSALLIILPLLSDPSSVEIPLLNERPYAEMTLRWLDSQHITYDAREDLQHIRIAGGQHYRPFHYRVNADASSATFLFCAAAITGGQVTCERINLNDGQGDFGVLDILTAWGCEVTTTERHDGLQDVKIQGAPLCGGGQIDLNAMPDSLPALAVTVCYAAQSATFTNIAHVRAKETDRIAIIEKELQKMGGHTESGPDWLTVHPRPLKGALVDGHEDHRIVMALGIAALGAHSPTTIQGAQWCRITYPNFFDDLRSLGARIIDLDEQDFSAAQDLHPSQQQ